MTLVISKKLYHEIIEHCKRELPYETCGLLSGKEENIVSRWEFQSPYRYRHSYYIEKNMVQEVINKVKKKQEEVIGIYHTHPTADPIPSSTDIKYHLNSEVRMIIVSLKSIEPQVKCYKLKDDAYVEEAFIVDPG